ncbi:hypothetical protein [Allostreptomyces psammosilenae]|uniref:Uncharacterized protein n=1 Tax=Allostreptomyces psammosilenae TaxID=1892865 RepID=A0A852ZQV1_9ACTN|nr:hypothetical protein [Allostreptomyces psammosilenae]NYI04759.1 hypothetical protein [Allostreptomyces psammosilenae]
MRGAFGALAVVLAGGAVWAASPTWAVDAPPVTSVSSVVRGASAATRSVAEETTAVNPAEEEAASEEAASEESSRSRAPCPVCPHRP